MTEEEITGVRDLPLQVRPWAVRQHERHRALEAKVNDMEPVLKTLHDDSQQMKGSIRVVVWLLGTSIVVGLAHLAQLLVHR